MSNTLCIMNLYDIFGDYSVDVHLFPFRTEKLSSIAQMILLLPDF